MTDVVPPSDQRTVPRLLTGTRHDLARLVTHCPAVLYRLDWQPAFRTAFISDNAERITGFTPEALTTGATAWRARIHPDDLLPGLAFRQQLELTGRVVQEYRFQHADGEWRWFHDEMAFRTTDEGDTELLGSVLDVTDRRALQEQLTQSNHLGAIGSLAAGIAHEINTPAQFVSDNVHFLQSAFTQLLRVVQADEAALADAEVPAASRAVVDAVRRGADIPFIVAEVPPALAQAADGLQRIARIVQAVKRFAHPNRGELEPVALGPVIAAALDVSRNEWKYDAEATLDVPDGLPLILGSAGELQQVFLNLFVNAAHAIADQRTMTGGGLGTLRTVVQPYGPDAVEIRVSDSGCGISPAVRHRIFEPFFTTKDVGRGSGQGLALCWSVVVDQHGGTIDAESAVGGGTTFVIRLPIAGPRRDGR